VLRKTTVVMLVSLALIALLATALVGLPGRTVLKASAAGVPAAAPADPLVGFGAGTTGGAGGPTVTVTTLSALESAVSGSSPKIVQVSGTITGDTNLMVGPNTTLIGLGSTASLVGISVDITNVSNVIVRNLSISYVLASDTTGDAIHIQGGGATHIWIDHNNLFSDLNHGKDYYDGLIDITHAADYITVSWNRLHDHYKVSLIGHSDSNGAEDTGHFHVTYHHNWFYNDNSRMPSIRFGTAHIYNNYFENVGDSAIHSREGAQTLIENNYFDGTGTAITTTGDSPVDGYANARGNIYNGATVDITQVGTFTQAPYSYTLDDASAVPAEVMAYSGVGIISGSGGGPTPTPGTTPTPTPTVGSTPTPTPTHGVTPTPTSTSGASCSVHYAITNQWPGGFSASFTITNTGGTAINGWNLQFSFPNGQTITQLWNGTYTQSGSTVTIASVSYNGSIPPGGQPSSEPGFNGTWNNSTNNAPTSFMLNGVACSVS